MVTDALFAWDDFIIWASQDAVPYKRGSFLDDSGALDINLWMAAPTLVDHNSEALLVPLLLVT